MSADLFVLVSLGALLAFILWEGWRSRRGPLAKRVRSPAGFVPGGAAHELGILVLAVVFLAAGLLTLYSPELGTSMRRTFLFRMVESVLGPLTGFAMFVGAAIAAFVGGILMRKKRLARSRGGNAG